MAHPATSDIVSSPTFREGKYREILAGFEQVLELHAVSAWGVFSMMYFSWALYISNRKQLWFDEIVSYSVDHLPTWPDAWRALQLGVDANPPLFHLVNRLLLGIFGDSTFVERVSSVFGFWAMSLCVYNIVRRNHPAASAWVAALIPACSGAAYYATEARPYGMVLGFVSLAVVCWLNAVETEGDRRWWLAGMTLALACGISSHYYAVYTVAPFIGAELTRALKRKQIDWAVLGATIASFFPLVIFYFTGLISAAGKYSTAGGSVSFLGPVDFWSTLLSPVAASIVLVVAASLGLHWMVGKVRWQSVDFGSSTTVLIAAWFCVLPVVVTLAAHYVTNAYAPRYALTAVIGVAVLIGIGFDLLRTIVPGGAVLAILALIVPVAADAIGGRANPRGRHIDYSWEKYAMACPELPVVYGRPLEFVQAWHNAPSSELKSRIIGLVNVKEAFDRTGETMEDLCVINLKPALPVPAMDYFRFEAERRPFYLISQPSVTSWVTDKLIDDGAILTLKGQFAGEIISLVTWPRPETAPEPPPMR
jgi:hypothetical protein